MRFLQKSYLFDCTLGSTWATPVPERWATPVPECWTTMGQQRWGAVEQIDFDYKRLQSIFV